MTSRSLHLVHALAIALALAACAPDSIRPNTAFDAWTGRVAEACNYTTIGRYEVGQLLGMNATDKAIVFLDSTSRLYAGEITTDQWTLSVTTDLGGQPTDAGIACVLDQLPAR